MSDNKTKKTKKMAQLETEIVSASKMLDEFSMKHKSLVDFEVKTGEGKKAKEDAIVQLQNEIATCRHENESRRAQLEIAIVEMLAGIDQDFAEPSPSDALRQVS